MEKVGNSNHITRRYIDSLLIETRYLDSTVPTTEFSLYGETFSTPVMTAAISHLDHHIFEGASTALAEGAKNAGAVVWFGMADEAEIESIAATGARLIEIIKPYADRELIYQKIRHAEKLGLLAVGIDIDHPFANDGSWDICFDYELKALTTIELAQICKSTKLPVIVKGVLSWKDAEKALAAGVKGMVLSHHNNRIEYAVPPLAILPEIVERVSGRVPVFVDCEIQTGMDAFKALALGAAGVCIGRPLMAALQKDSAKGVEEYIRNATNELKKAMAFTGCTDLGKMDPTVIRKI